MPAAQIIGQVAPDVLELIRKTVFGNNIPNQSFDFNGLFGPLGNSLAGNSSPESLQSLIENIQSPGGGPANNASGTASPQGLAAVNAAMSVVGNQVMSAFNPLAPVVANQVAHTPSTLSSIQTFLDAIFHPDAFNASIDTNAPVSANANDAGLSQAADSQAAFNDAGGDSGDGGATGATGSAGGQGDSGGPGDSGGGAYFNGGFVPGPPTGQDKVNINVDGGEFIVPHDIVDMLGKNFFEELMLTRSPLEVAAEKEAAKAAKGSK